MEERFIIKLDNDEGVLVIEDRKTGEKGAYTYKNENDISFLRALYRASDDLLEKLEDLKESESDEDLEATHECEKEPEEKKEDQPTYYSGVAEIVKGDNFFEAGKLITVSNGEPSYFTGELVKDIVAMALFSGIKIKSFDDLKKMMESVKIEIKEVKEDEK